MRRAERLLTFASVILVLVAAQSYDAERRDDLRRAQVTACERGNVRANEHIDTLDPRRHARRTSGSAIFPLIDCAATATVNAVAPVPLDAGQMRAYIALVRQARLPIVTDGQIVGSTAP